MQLATPTGQAEQSRRDAGAAASDDPVQEEEDAVIAVARRPASDFASIDDSMIHAEHEHGGDGSSGAEEAPCRSEHDTPRRPGAAAGDSLCGMTGQDEGLLESVGGAASLLSYASDGNVARGAPHAGTLWKKGRGRGMLGRRNWAVRSAGRAVQRARADMTLLGSHVTSKCSWASCSSSREGSFARAWR